MTVDAQRADRSISALINFIKVSAYFFLNKSVPPISVNIINVKKMKNMTFAIEAAPVAIPVKPNSAATIAITKKIAVHLSIMIYFKF